MHHVIFFDKKYYLNRNGDVRDARIDPIMHFICYGYKEGRAPIACLEGKMPESLPEETFNEYMMRFAVSLEQNRTCSHVIERSGSYETMHGMTQFVNWCITDMCNYQCSYCFGQTKPDKQRFTDFSYIVNAIDNLERLNRPFLYNLQRFRQHEFLNKRKTRCSQTENL